MTIDETIAERHNIHGDFTANAHISQGLKGFIVNQPGYANLSEIQRESLDFICTKISRILSGDPNHSDHWHDIQGYARLAESDVLGALAEKAVEREFTSIKSSDGVSFEGKPVPFVLPKMKPNSFTKIETGAPIDSLN